MQDYTAEVIRLEAAYTTMQIARKRVSDEVKAEFRSRIRAEVERRQEEVEAEFARLLKEASERGLPGSVIRAEVLRTQDWGRWKKWRDKGEILPERVVIANAREEKKRANLVFEWIENVLHVYKNPATGENLPGTLVYPYYTKTGAFTGLSEGIFSEFENCIRRVLGLDNQESNKAFFLPIMQEIKRAFNTGELTEETAPGWREDSYDQEAEEIGEKMFELNGWVKR